MADLTSTNSNVPFRAPTLKIKRALQHLAEMETVVSAYLQNGPARWDVVETDEGVQLQFSMDGTPDIISAIAGDIFHNLRAALDLLACELCRINKQPDVGVYFPFCESENELENMIRRRNFHLSGDEAVRLLKEMKPYKGGNVALRAIHDLDIEDKHKALIPAALSSASPVLEVVKDQGAPKLRVVDNQPQGTELKLVFPNDSPLAGQEVIPTLHHLVQTTTSVIEAFKSLSVPS